MALLVVTLKLAKVLIIEIHGIYMKIAYNFILFFLQNRLFLKTKPLSAYLPI